MVTAKDANEVTGTKRAATKRPALSRQDRKNLIKGILFISPWVIGFLVFTLWPSIYVLILSFTRYSGLGAPVWLGLQNYQRLLVDDLFWKSLGNTFFYCLLAVPIGAVVAIVMALAMNRSVREIAVYRAIFYLPSILPAFAMSFIVMALISPQYGLVSWLLSLFGVPKTSYLSDPWGAKIVIVAMAQLGAGNAALIFLAGLKGIPETLYEAARLDGAGPVRRFFNITLPLISPIVLFNLITGISSGLQVFTQAYIMTNGGPNNETLFYMLYLYKNAFSYAQFGYASALSIVLFVIGLIMALITYVVSKRFVTYDLVS